MKLFFIIAGWVLPSLAIAQMITGGQQTSESLTSREDPVFSSPETPQVDLSTEGGFSMTLTPGATASTPPSLPSVSAAEKVLSIRNNRLLDTYAVNVSDLSPKNRLSAWKFGMAWVDLLKATGLEALTQKGALEDLYERRLAPGLESLAQGNTSEASVLAAGKTVYLVMVYAGDHLHSGKPLDNTLYNTYLRIGPGNSDKATLEAGMKEFLFDYLELVDPSKFQELLFKGALK